MPKSKLGMISTWFKTSVWAFPAVLAGIMFVLVLFQISGSSVGVYHQKFYGADSKDTNLIYGRPQPIRSDEWLLNTQRIISQSKNNFNVNNPDIPGGDSISFKDDIPSKDWSTLFRPQNWGFLILPLETAFAFKWWLPMFLLIVSCYFFVLKILPRQNAFAIILSVAIGLSPFELWWYQTGAFFVVAFGFMLAILGMRIIDNDLPKFIHNKILAKASLVISTAFIAICFGLIFYPPFQIPILIVLFFFLGGYVLQKLYLEKIKFGQLANRLSLLVLAAIITGIVGIIFIKTHQQPLEILGKTVYPGQRMSHSGGLKLLQVFNGFVMPLQQSGLRGGNFISNQSETSNFILLLPFLIIPGIFFSIYTWLKLKRPDWTFLSLQVCAILLFIRMFTPFGDKFFKLLLLNRVPNQRIIIGLGFLGIFYIVYLLKLIRQSKFPALKLKLAAAAYGAVCFVILVLIGLYIRRHYPIFLHESWLIIGLSGFFAALIAVFLADMRILFVSLFLVFTMGSSFRIMPLYRGLDIITTTPVIKKMQALSTSKQPWVTVGDDAIVYENFGLVAGRPSLSGTQVYPDLEFWSQLGSQYQNIYNRQSHIFYTDNPEQTQPIKLVASSTIRVKFECSNFVTKNADFALSVHPLNASCVHLVDTVNYPAQTFYLYKVNK